MWGWGWVGLCRGGGGLCRSEVGGGGGLCGGRVGLGVG